MRRRADGVRESGGKLVRALVVSQGSSRCDPLGTLRSLGLVRIPVVPAGADGRAVVQPTVQFRLPDGSAMAHLLLAGIVQALLASRDERDLEGLLEATSIRPPEGAVAEVDPLPRDFPSVAAALDRQRGRLEAGRVFPRELHRRYGGPAPMRLSRPWS